MRGHWVGVVALVGVCVAGAPATARADETIFGNGPIESIHVGADLACQVAYAGDDSYEFYPPDTSPGDCGAMISVDGRLYAPDYEAHGRSAADSLSPWDFLAPQSETLTGDGSAANPYVVTTNVTAGDDVGVQMRTSYTRGRPSYRVDLTVRNTSQTATHNVQVYFAADCYASGSDIGYGFTRPEIKSFGCSQNPDNTPQARTIQLLPLSPGSLGFENYYDDVWARIGSLTDFDNSCRCGESLDNGVALEWKASLRNLQTAEYSLDVAFTESQAPPMADSDGDAIPDAWETGQGGTGDAENLAALGANPNRKDIFVQADWMSGCAPPAGWERRAIDMFAAHGIALHVDSGAGAMNVESGADPANAAARLPWGARSRAGEVTYSDDLPKDALWQTVDALKDQHFIPAGRRRAFHYVIFVNKVRGTEGLGVSRGLPDSDLVIGNCHTPKRASDVFFVHELGHNLGLHHGGNDDNESKAHYYSVMNYAWAFNALTDPRQFYSYSDAVQEPLDEHRLDERKGIQLPLLIHCPKDQRDHPSFLLDTGRFPRTVGALDLNCDGVWGDTAVSADLDKDGALTTETGFNDWASLEFGGGGIIGALTAPARPAGNVEGEFGEPAIEAYAAAAAAAARRNAKQLTIVTKTTQLRKPKKRRKTTMINVQVKTVTGKAIKKAALGVKGATIVKRGRRQPRTDRHGRFTIRLRLRSTKQLQITAARAGYKRGALIITVRKS